MLKKEYKPWRDVMLDSMGRFRTTSLFWETRKTEANAEKYPPIFTTKPKDFTTDGKTYRSLKAIYFSYDHVPDFEYEFAMDVFGSWDHWLALFNSFQLKPIVQSWRDELSIKIKAEALKTLLTQSKDPDKGLQAARAILAGEHKSSKRGRPSKEEVERRAKEATRDRDTLDADIERLGLVVVK
jgi:hypothetical protein